MLSGTASTVAMSEHPDSLRLDLDTLEIKDTECFPRFKCIHIDFPGKEILHAIALDFDASYESLDAPLFHSDKDRVRKM